MLTGKGHAETALFGGLDKFTNEPEAKEWLKQRLTQLGVETPADIYTKGTFTGILFARFSCGAVRDGVASAFWKARLEYGGKLTWSRPDLPLEQRVPESFLFALRKQLME